MDIKIFFLIGWLVTNLPAEPTEKYLVQEYYDFSVGLYFREYKILSPTINYRTARIIKTISVEDEDENIDDQPIFYWFDYNNDGKFEQNEMWRNLNGKIIQ